MNAKSKKTPAIQQRLLNGKSGPQTEKNKAYLYIQKEGQLPIPSMNTIRRMLSPAERKFGLRFGI